MTTVQIDFMENMPAAVPHKLSMAAGPLPGAENFGTRWQSEVNATSVAPSGEEKKGFTQAGEKAEVTTPAATDKEASVESASDKAVGSPNMQKSHSRDTLTAATAAQTAVDGKPVGSPKKNGAAALDKASAVRSKLKQSAKRLSPSTVPQGASADATSLTEGIAITGAPIQIPLVALHRASGGKTDTAGIVQVPGIKVPEAGQAEAQAVKAVGEEVSAASAKPVAATSVTEIKSKRSFGAAATDVPPSATAGTPDAASDAGGLRVGAVGPHGMPGQMLHSEHSSTGAGGSEAQGGETTSNSDTGAKSPMVVSSTPARLDVGVLDGTHGWIRIRAELGAGGTVNAALIATESAHDSLRAALPAMANYLGSEAVNVDTIALHRFTDTSGTTTGANHDGQSSSSQRDQTRGGDAGQGLVVEETGGNTQDQLAAAAAPNDNAPITGVAYATSMALGGWSRSASQDAPGLVWHAGMSGGGSGNWLNVSA